MPDRFLALTLVALVALLPGAAFARLIPLNGNAFNQTTNPPTNDLWCNGGQIAGNVTKAATELCQDYTGSLVPTTPNVQNLGSAALPYANVYSVNAVVTGSDASGVAGTTGVSGTGGTAATQSSVLGVSVYGKVAVTGIVTSTIVPVNSSYETVMSTSGTTVTMTSTPNISTTTVVGGAVELPSGTYLVLSSTGASGVIFQDAGTLTGSQLQLGSATRTVTQYKTLTLIYDATDHFWREISFGNN